MYLFIQRQYKTAAFQIKHISWIVSDIPELFCAACPLFDKWLEFSHMIWLTLTDKASLALDTHCCTKTVDIGTQRFYWKRRDRFVAIMKKCSSMFLCGPTFSVKTDLNSEANVFLCFHLNPPKYETLQQSLQSYKQLCEADPKYQYANRLVSSPSSALDTKHICGCWKCRYLSRYW